jgi:hypothetical protein
MGLVNAMTALLVAGVPLIGCGGNRETSSAAPRPRGEAPAVVESMPARRTAERPDSTGWVISDSTMKSAILTLEVTRPSGSASALLSGYRAGQARIIVPLGWTTRWNWRNADPASPHSLVLMIQREKIPLEAGRPAFSNAMTRSATAGLPPGGMDQTTFEAEEAGWYWLLCGVPSHALEGEWLELRVDPEARQARLEIKR